MKKILITGANSFIGISVERWLNKEEKEFFVDTIDMIDGRWHSYNFSGYDCVFHVAGLAHADVGKVSDETRNLYYKVNSELAIETAKVAKNAGVKQFIFMSSMIVYSGCGETYITENTPVKALNFYGDSKIRAEEGLNKLADEKFKVVILRPPMIYGKGSKGNYPLLAKMANKLPIFPTVKNKRSMIHIDNLCEFVKLIIENEESGTFFPQNGEYTNTSDMVRMIAEVNGNKIIMLPGTNFAIKLMCKLPGKVGGLATKAFGNLIYEMGMSEYKVDYRIRDLKESIEFTEGKK